MSGNGRPFARIPAPCRPFRPETGLTWLGRPCCENPVSVRRVADSALRPSLCPSRHGCEPPFHPVGVGPTRSLGSVVRGTRRVGGWGTPAMIWNTAAPHASGGRRRAEIWLPVNRIPPLMDERRKHIVDPAGFIYRPKACREFGPRSMTAHPGCLCRPCRMHT